MVTKIIMKNKKRIVAMIAMLCVLVTSVNWPAIETRAAESDDAWLLSRNRPAYASGVNGGDVPAFAVDGGIWNKWQDKKPDNSGVKQFDHWIEIDLGVVSDIKNVEIDWSEWRCKEKREQGLNGNGELTEVIVFDGLQPEPNKEYATKYKIQVSDDEVNWTDIYDYNYTAGWKGPGRSQATEEISDIGWLNGKRPFSYVKEEVENLNGRGRYIRLYITQKGLEGAYGSVVRRFEVYGQNDITSKPDVRTNIALKKDVKASSEDYFWGTLERPEYAVNGDPSNFWKSKEGHKEWIMVDLGKEYEIGEVDIAWVDEYGLTWELQAATDSEAWNDAKSDKWKTVYRQLAGTGEDEIIKIKEKARYLKMQGVGMAKGNGYSIVRFEAYEYRNGIDNWISPPVSEIPEAKVIDVGEGSYLYGDVNLHHPKTPKYVTENVPVPIPSNQWWTSVVWQRLSNMMVVSPLVAGYTGTGLEIYHGSELFSTTDNAAGITGAMGASCKYKDLVIIANNIVGKPAALADGFGDYSADIIYTDEYEPGGKAVPKLRSTFVKGSPYIYNTFTDSNAPEIFSANLVGLFDKDGNEILRNDGDIYEGDHIGMTMTNQANIYEDQHASGQKKEKTFTRHYGIYAPANTKFVRVGNKVKVQLGNNEKYMSVAVLSDKAIENQTKTKAELLEYMYEHAYAFVTDTKATYEYDDKTANMVTKFTSTIDRKRADKSADPVILLMPHQWKHSDATLDQDISYGSARGLEKAHIGNSFNTTLRFQGITPMFDEPVESTGDDGYRREWMERYLEMFKTSALNDYWVEDPYWQGKKTHPLAMGILIAQELGDYETRDEFIKILKNILQGWLTYDGKDDLFYMYYHPSWGSMSGYGGDFGMAKNLTDHHFLWAYFMFPAAVLATYDQDFMDNYGGMVDHLVRDCLNPDDDDELYPHMRNFDIYEGHCWAGGYADNDDGNNQESAGEATFAWAGLYLWGLVSGNKEYRDAGIWGYTSEVNAIEQYWFNYGRYDEGYPGVGKGGAGTENDNWAKSYNSGSVGMVIGNTYNNGTYFGGNPCLIYGIHLLPVTGAQTYMGYDPEIAGKIWAEYDYFQTKHTEATGEEPGWFHVMWPFLAASDPDKAANLWYNYKRNDNVYLVNGDSSTDKVLPHDVPNDEALTSYWYIQNMRAKGLREVSIWSNNWTAYQVFNKDGKYSATVWNPTDQTIYVEFSNDSGVIGSTYVYPKATISVDPFKENGLPEEDAPPEANIEQEVHKIPSRINATEYSNKLRCWNGEERGVDSCVGGFTRLHDPKPSYAEYKIDVPTAGEYKITFNVRNVSQMDGPDEARYVNNAYIDIKNEGDLIGNLLIEPDMTTNPAGNHWVQKTTTVHLEAGEQVLTLYPKGDFRLAWFAIYQGDDIPEAVKEEGNLGPNIAKNKTVTASSTPNNVTRVVDGNLAGPGWQSEESNPQWVCVNLGNSYLISGVKLYWEAAAGKDYEIQVADSASGPWRTVFTRTDFTKGLEDEIIFDEPVNAQYVRMYGTARRMNYGYHLFEFEIYQETRESLSGATISGLSNAYDYTGKAITPVPVVKNNGKTLTLDEDYTLSYLNNVNAGDNTASVIIRGKGQNYYGTKTVNYSINKKDISQFEVEALNAQTYTGSPLKPVITVKNGNRILTYGLDYTVAYTNNTNVGTANVVITGTNNYKGTINNTTFKIINEGEVKDISSAAVTVSSQKYTGIKIEPKGLDVIVKYDGNTLQEGKDYELGYPKANINAGTNSGSITIAGKGNYSGTKTVQFTINAKGINEADVTVTGIPKEIQVGETVTVKVMHNSKELSVSKDNGTTGDYTVKYRNTSGGSSNFDVSGTIEVTITGINNYTGEVKQTFVVKERTTSPEEPTTVEKPTVEKPTVEKPTGEKPTTKVNLRFTVGKLKYEVSKTKSNEVMVTKMKSKNYKSVKIPAKVKYKSKTYKVTSIKKNAFKNSKKLKAVTIGTNIKIIGDSAFSDCKKLKIITFNTTKLKKVGKNAFKSIYKKAIFKVSAKQKNKYKKLLKRKITKGNKIIKK